MKRAALVFFLAAAAIAGDAVKPSYDANGLTGVAVGKHPGITNGKIRVTKVLLTQAYRDKNKEEHEKQLLIPAYNDPYGGDNRTLRKGSVTPKATRFDADKKELTQEFPWGVLSVTYREGKNQLDLDVAIACTGKDVIEYLEADLLAFQPANGAKPGVLSNQPGWARCNANIGAPLVLQSDLRGGKMVVCSPSPGGPLTYRFLGGKGPRRVQLRVGQPSTGGEVFDGVWAVRPIPPKKTDEFTISLRFDRPGGTPTDRWAMARDAAANFRKRHPFMLKWPDRRPIGAVHLGDTRTSEANPRGWRHAMGIPDTWDVREDKKNGYAEFHKYALQAADRLVAHGRKLGLQGIVVWQPCGQEYAKQSYYGEPRLMPYLAPEMEGIADEFYARIRKGGLRPGICIRPNIHYAGDADKKPVPWDQIETLCPRHWVSPKSDTDVYHPDVKIPYARAEAQSPMERLSEKIKYAQKRWGCTIFYIDTNHFWRPRDRSTGGWAWKGKMMAAEDFEELCRRHPDVLLIPEHEYVQYWSATAPYLQPPGYGWCTPADVRAVYPKAFSVMCTSIGGKHIQDHLAVYLRAVCNGDIFMPPGWYGGKPEVKFYRQAATFAPYRVRVKKDLTLAVDKRSGTPWKDLLPAPEKKGPKKDKDAPLAEDSDDEDLLGNEPETPRFRFRKATEARSPGALTRYLGPRLGQKEKVTDRRVWVVYHRGVEPDKLQKVFDAIAKANGIIAWSSVQE